MAGTGVIHNSQMPSTSTAGDDANYVDAVLTQPNKPMAVSGSPIIMSGSPITISDLPTRTPLRGGRKRYLSASDVTESDMKKLKRVDSADTTDRLEIVKVKRKLMNNRATPNTIDVASVDASPGLKAKHVDDKRSKKTSGKGKTKGKGKASKGSPRIDTDTLHIAAEVHSEDTRESDIGSMLNTMFPEPNEAADGKDIVNVMNRLADEMTKINSNMEKMWRDMNKKMETMAENIEKRLSNKINNAVDKRVNAESAKLKNDMNKKIDEVRDDINNDIKCLQQQVDELPRNMDGRQSRDDKELNLCIRNHPQRDGENVGDIVTDLLRDGLRLRGMGFRKAVRKDRDDRRPGVIIVTCNRREDKNAVMEKKQQLRNNKKYERVYIHADQSVETRVNNNNLKLLISKLGVSGIRLKGSRLVIDNEDNRPRDSTADAPRDNYEHVQHRRGGNRGQNYRTDNNTRSREYYNDNTRYGRQREDSNRNNDYREQQSAYHGQDRRSEYRGQEARRVEHDRVERRFTR